MLFLERDLGVSNDRFLHAGIKEHEWGSFVNQMYRILKPGGWAQCGEVYGFSFQAENDDIPEDCILEQVVFPPVSRLISSSSVIYLRASHRMGHQICPLKGTGPSSSRQDSRIFKSRKS